MNISKKIKDYFNRISLAGMVLAAESGAINLQPKGEFVALETVTAGSFVSSAIQIILIVAAIVAVVFLIFGGIKWITSGGDKAQVESARNTVTAALIGLLIVFATWALIQLMNFFFGIDVLNFTLPKFTTE